MTLPEFVFAVVVRLTTDRVLRPVKEAPDILNVPPTVTVVAPTLVALTEPTLRLVKVPTLVMLGCAAVITVPYRGPTRPAATTLPPVLMFPATPKPP